MGIVSDVRDGEQLLMDLLQRVDALLELDVIGRELCLAAC